MKPLRPALLLACSALLPSLVASPSSADAAASKRRLPPRPSARLVSVEALPSRGVPSSDVAAVEEEVRRALRRRAPRVRRCLIDTTPPADPLRRWGRSLGGRLRFSRARRPTVRLERARGLPAAARSCILEAVGSLAVRTAPRGTVEVRFRYVVH